MRSPIADIQAGIEEADRGEFATDAGCDHPEVREGGRAFLSS